MKIKAIGIIEIVLFLSFESVYFLQNRNVTNCGWTLLILYILLGSLYFPLGFYTLYSTKFDRLYSSLFGILFSGSITGIFFALINYDLSVLLLMLLIALYVMVAFVPLISYNVFGLHRFPIIVFSNKGITIRWFVYFALMIYALFTYKWQN